MKRIAMIVIGNIKNNTLFIAVCTKLMQKHRQDAKYCRNVKKLLIRIR